MSISQKAYVRRIIKHYIQQGHNRLHLGCCYGADTEVFEMFKDKISVVAHPCNIVKWTNNDIVDNADFVYPVVSPLARNRRIVQLSLVLIATPHVSEESLGTQYTIQYAMNHNVFFHIAL